MGRGRIPDVVGVGASTANDEACFVYVFCVKRSVDRW